MHTTIRSPAFIETGSCGGSRYIRSQPSRESGQVPVLDESHDLSYLNVDRYIKEVKYSWDKLNEQQKESIRKSLEDFNIQETFGNIDDSNAPETKHPRFTKEKTVIDFINFLGENPKENTKKFMSILWYPNDNQRMHMNVSDHELNAIRNNTYIEGNKLPRTGAAFSFFMLLLFFVVILLIFK